MAELTPNLTKLLQEHFPDEAERNAAVWRHKASGKWLAHHWALMRMARRLDFDIPEAEHILRAFEPETVVLLQRMSVRYKGGYYATYAYGVATNENNRNGHHYPMAKKRGEDQCIIDLLERIYDMALRKDLYGEDESDSFAKPEEPVARTKTERVRELDERKADLDKEVEEGLMSRMKPPETLDILDEWRARILACTTRAELQVLYEDELLPNVEQFTKKENKELQAMFAAHGMTLK